MLLPRRTLDVRLANRRRTLVFPQATNKGMMMPDRTCEAAVFAMLAILLAGLPVVAPIARAQAEVKSRSFPGGSGLAVPRFVSVKSSRVNMRKGPGTEYPTVWVYRRAGMPLEVIKEFEGWRQVRDADGATGWVLQSFLSGRRTALVLPWEIKEGVKAPHVALRMDDHESASPVAMVEAGVVANLSSCDGRWCRVNIDRYGGYIEQKKLWGVYENERIN
jgi:SH3-like domain-containing protein